jgi:hypothetical protein
MTILWISLTVYLLGCAVWFWCWADGGDTHEALFFPLWPILWLILLFARLARSTAKRGRVRRARAKGWCIREACCSTAEKGSDLCYMHKIREEGIGEGDAF